MKQGYKDYFYVGLQLVLFGLYGLPYSPIRLGLPKIFALMGIAFAVLGFFVVIIAFFKLGTALSPYPTPKEDSRLRSTGIYKFVRHPIYSGLILGFTGYGFFDDSLYKLIITALLVLLFYFKSAYEERQLINQFGQDYEEYRFRTGRFLPKVF